MPGIIETVRETPIAGTEDMEPDAAAAANTTSGYDAERIEVDPTEDTVQGRISNVISANSPLMQAAGTRAKQEANRRGVLNSTMAIGAGEKAVLDTALPIAQQDAQTYSDARTANAAAGNAALDSTARAMQARELQEGEGIIASRLQAEEGDITSRHLTEEGDIRSGQIELEGDIESRHIGEEGAVQEGLIEATSEANINELIASGDINSRLMFEEYNLKTDLEHERAAIEVELMNADTANRAELIARQGEIDVELQDMRIAGQLEISDLEGQWRSLIQTSGSAASYMSSVADQIGSILANENINTANKQTLINQIKDLARDNLAILGGIADLDLGLGGTNDDFDGVLQPDGTWQDSNGDIVFPNPGDIGSWLTNPYN